MSRAERLREALVRGLAPARLEIVDESAQHAGHAGARPGGETHYAVTVVAEAFQGRSRVDRQRMVYDLVAAELAGGLHALRLTTRTPAEDRSS